MASSSSSGAPYTNTCPSSSSNHSFFSTISSSSSDISPLHIVLDIDNVLADTDGVEQALTDIPITASWYKDNGLMAISPHILFPAAIEFIQYLFRIPNCQISFFSSGLEERNILFVKELLTRAMGAESYEKIKEKVHIFSRQHLKNCSRERDTQHPVFQGIMKKDLNITLLPGIPLSSTIMIDDSFSYCISGQEKNFLKVKAINHINIEKATSKEASQEDIQRINNIFYVVGLLKTVIDRGRSFLTDSLLELQFKKPTTKFKPLENIGENPEYFLIGLRELRKINPLLKFYGASGRVQECFNENFVSSIGPSSLTSAREVVGERKIEAKPTSIVPLFKLDDIISKYFWVKSLIEIGLIKKDEVCFYSEDNLKALNHRGVYMLMLHKHLTLDKVLALSSEEAKVFDNHDAYYEIIWEQSSIDEAIRKYINKVASAQIQLFPQTSPPGGPELNNPRF